MGEREAGLYSHRSLHTQMGLQYHVFSRHRKKGEWRRNYFSLLKIVWIACNVICGTATLTLLYRLRIFFRVVCTICGIVNVEDYCDLWIRCRRMNIEYNFNGNTSLAFGSMSSSFRSAQSSIAVSRTPRRRSCNKHSFQFNSASALFVFVFLFDRRKQIKFNGWCLESLAYTRICGDHGNAMHSKQSKNSMPAEAYKPHSTQSFLLIDILIVHASNTFLLLRHIMWQKQTHSISYITFSLAVYQIEKKTESSSRCHRAPNRVENRLRVECVMAWVWRQPNNSSIEIIKFSGGSCNIFFSLKYCFDFTRHQTKEFLLCIVSLNWLNGELTDWA